MSSRKDIKDSRGHIIGWIKTESSQITIHDSKGHQLGKYNPRMDQTTNARGSFVGKGNQLTMLLS